MAQSLTLRKMGSRFLKYLLLKSSFVFACSISFGQVQFINVQNCYAFCFKEDVNKYDNIFIIHFSFCNGTNYCGKNLADYILLKTSKSENNLVISDDTINPLITFLKSEKNITTKYINSTTIEKFGIFSVYNVHINRKRRIKRLE